MISPQSLEMIPPILGRERTFGWYPPAHEQYARVPYKSMAVLEDYSNFKTQVKIEKDFEDKSEKESPANGSTVLSLKLNAIRQDLTRRRIDPNVLRQSQIKKYDNINQYMNIAQDWKAKYPEPNLEIPNNINSRHSAPANRDCHLLSNEENLSETNYKRSENNLFDQQQEYQDNQIIDDISNKPTTRSNISKIKRPHTAPGNYLKVQVSLHSPTKSSQCRQISAAGSLNSCKSRINSQLNGMSKSQSSIPLTTYEEDIAKYKWMMEVPGDPFNIKQPHIPVKQPYFLKIEDCKILPSELRMSKQNRDTFFYNTRPHQSLTFDISPNFTSEKYNAMKNLLRSQGKWNYSSKNFSFVY